MRRPLHWFPHPAHLAFHPSSYDYGAVPVNETRWHTFTLANTGGSASGALKVTTEVAHGENGFFITATTCQRQSLKPGRSCTVTARFAPNDPFSSYIATLQAVGRHAARATAHLTGRGAHAEQSAPRLYWANCVGDTLMRASQDGTGLTTLVSSPETRRPRFVAVNSSHIYWTGEGTTGADVIVANVSGTRVKTLVTGPGVSAPEGVAVDATHVYWANGGGSQGIPTGSIMEANLNGTRVRILVARQNRPEGVAVEGDHIYWTARPVLRGGTIMEADLNNPAATVTTPR